MTYPNGRVLNYTYGAVSSVDDAISRLAALKDHDGTTVLESYTYLGDGTMLARSNPAVTLSLLSAATSDSGDPYTGLDRFGAVIDQKWVASTTTPSITDEFTYTYDTNSNRLTEGNTLHNALYATYTYDALNRLSHVTGGTVQSQDWALDAL